MTPTSAPPEGGAHGQRWVVIADDLTGAADSSSPHAGEGAPVRILRWPPSDPPATATVAVTTSSRELSPSAAGARLDEALAWRHDRLPDHRLFKKIDSTLRGHVAVELEVLADTLDDDAWLLVCPAVPCQGRVVADGAALRDVVPRSTPAAHLDLDAVREDHAALIDRIGQELAGGARILTASAVTDDDLSRLAAAANRAERTPVHVGARGLAAACAPGASGGRRAQAPPWPRGRYALVVGSAHPATREQLRVLEAQGPRGVADTSGSPVATVEHTCGVLLVPRAPDDEAAATDEERRALEQALAARTAELLAASPVDWLILVGGQTADAVLDALDIRVLEVAGEIQEGVVVGRPIGSGDGPSIVLRSGGFGDRDALVDLLSHLDLDTE